MMFLEKNMNTKLNSIKFKVNPWINETSYISKLIDV